MPTEASQRLAEALRWVEGDMGLVLEYREFLIPLPLQDDVMEVWPIIRDRIAMLVDAMESADADIDGPLEAVGLTGRQLEMKLEAHRMARGRAQAAAEQLAGASRPSRGFRRIFRSLLGWINVWLGSFAQAVPGGDVVKEYKEYLEQGMDDLENLQS